MPQNGSRASSEAKAPKHGSGSQPGFRAMELLAEREAVVEIVNAAKGDPRLSSWEANFLNEIGHRLWQRDGLLLSDKQVEKLREIAAKVNAPYDPDALDAAAEG